MDEIDLVQRLRREWRLLFPLPCRVIVAVSGGSDSLGLVHLLVASGLWPGNALLVAHFDHGLRPDSGDDAGFVVATAHQLGLTSMVELWRPDGEGVGCPGGNLAERARLARYDFLWRCANQFGASHIVTGHHRDDQAETLLERLLRGSGVRGLGAMRSTRFMAEQGGPAVELVRPLLACSRAEIRAWLTGQGVHWREDPSNHKPTARRNRIRHEILPGLATIADGDVVRRLAATAGRMAQADDALEWALHRLWSELDPRPTDSGGISLAAAALLPLPDELLCRCLQRCYQQLHGDWQVPGSRAVAGFIRLLRGRRRHWTMIMRGLTLQRRQDRVFFLKRDHHQTAKCLSGDGHERF